MTSALSDRSPAGDATRDVARERRGSGLMVGGGLLLGTLGVFVEEARQDPLTAGAVDSAGYLWGLAMCLGGSLSYAGVTLIAKTEGSASSFALAWWQCLVGLLALAGWPLLHGWPAAGSAWAWLAGLGVIHTGLAYVVLYAGMSRLSTSRIALLQFVYPFTAVLLDWAVYGRTLSGVQASGMGLMGLALWAARRPG
jgi:drug/metabolite transporter (DMT)-like permease